MKFRIFSGNLFYKVNFYHSLVDQNYVYDSYNEKFLYWGAPPYYDTIEKELGG